MFRRTLAVSTFLFVVAGCAEEAAPTADDGVEVTPVDPDAADDDLTQFVVRDTVGRQWVRPAGEVAYDAFGLRVLDGMGHTAAGITLSVNTPIDSVQDWTYDEGAVGVRNGRMLDEAPADPRFVAIQDALAAGTPPDSTGFGVFTTIHSARIDLPPVIFAGEGFPPTIARAGEVSGLLNDPSASCDYLQRYLRYSDMSLWVRCEVGGAEKAVNPELGSVIDFAELSTQALPARAPDVDEKWKEIRGRLPEMPVFDAPEILKAAEDAKAEADTGMMGAVRRAAGSIWMLFTGTAEASGADTVCGTCYCSGSVCNTTTCGADYGKAKTTLDGHTVYNNGTGSCGIYQCVEWVKRFHQQCGTTYGDACVMWGSAYSSTYAQRPYFKMSDKGTAYAPYPGDVLYSSNSTTCDSTHVGHVSVVGAVSASTLSAYDQNFATSETQPKSLSYSTSSGYDVANRSSTYITYGWLRTGWDFYYSSSSPISGWTASNISTLSYGTDGATSYSRLTAMSTTAKDPYITSTDKLNINPKSAYGGKYVAIKLRTNATDRNIKVYFITDADTTWNETKGVTATISSSGTWQTVSVNMSSNSTWTAATNIRRLRVDPISTVSSTSEYVDLDYIRVTTN